VPTALRGRVFGLAGALSVGVTGICFLVAGWISERTSPAASVGICAIVTLGGLVLLAARWPREEISVAVAETFRAPEEPTSAEAAAPSLTAERVAAPTADDDLVGPLTLDDELVLDAGLDPDLLGKGRSAGPRTPPGG
jgi:hypothetical protein